MFEIPEYIKEFTLMDDDFMVRVLEDIPCTEYVLRIILDDPGLTVSEVIPQYEIRNLEGRSVRLDVFAQSGDGRLYDIEIQRDDRGAGKRRARHNSAMLDCKCLKRGDDTESLPETFVIFITENDILAGALPIYHIDRTVAETGEAFGDGSHILYVNGSYRGDTPIGRLIDDFNCKVPEKVHSDVLKERMEYFKTSEEGVKCMSRVVDKLIAEERKRADMYIKLYDSEKERAEKADKRADKANERADKLKKNIDKMTIYFRDMGWSDEQIEKFLSDEE